MVVQLNYEDFKLQISARQISVQYIQLEYGYDLYLIEGGLTITSIVKDPDDVSDFEDNYKSTANNNVLVGQIPFASKILKDGKKLFARTHGAEYSLNIGVNSLTFIVPYSQVKINEIEILGCELGDSVDFFVLDTTTGTFSTIPNYPLNQFGFGVKCPDAFYRRKSNYDADLFENMQLYVVYNSKSAKTVYVNYVLHEVK